MDNRLTGQLIAEGRAVLGIELGSTRIKAVLIDEQYQPIASGSHDWKNRWEQGIWTYRLEDVWAGIRDSYAGLSRQVEDTYGVALTNLKAIGISAMMHGYLPFDKDGQLLTEFRTWRNTMTEQAAAGLTALFGFNIPQRWSIAHLYQAMLNKESHVRDIAYLTTLSGYVHWALTGEKVLGVGDASGMFPIDSRTGTYQLPMVEQFDGLLSADGYRWRLRDVLPDVLPAGGKAGTLTANGARLLDPGGRLQPGIPLAPPEGDAGTGMTATNSVAPRTGNVSAGTSIFAMVVLEKELSRVYEEVDMVTTPTGKPVAMVHGNNCSSDIDAWAQMLCEFAAALGTPCTLPQALDALFYQALKGDADGGGLVAYNYFSGEPITRLDEGRPLFVRLPDTSFTFANFARTQLYAALATLAIGMEILMDREQVCIDSLLGHGGFFKAKDVGQQMLAAALNSPVSVMDTAGEGGAWGMALLSAYMVDKASGETLEEFLTNHVFSQARGSRVEPAAADVQGFARYLERFKAGLTVEKAAAEHIR